MLFSTAGTAGKARLTIAPDGPPGEGRGLQEHIRGETGGRRGPAGRHRAASGGPRRGSGRGRRQGKPEWQAVSPTACRSGPPGPGLPIKKERLVLQQTSNYQLSQWDAEDRIQREDFNSDNAKVDAALKSQMDALAAEQTAREALAAVVAKCGNCQIYTTSYTGTGTSGSNGATTLTFSKPPLLIIISSSDVSGVCAWQGTMRAIFTTTTVSCTTTFSNDRKTVSWYRNNPADQMNKSGTIYYVTVLMAAD